MIFFVEVRLKRFYKRKMSNFKYIVTKILEGGEIWKHEVIIRANEKLDARAKIDMMYPSPEYECKFIETC